MRNSKFVPTTINTSFCHSAISSDQQQRREKVESVVQAVYFNLINVTNHDWSLVGFLETYS